MTILTGDLVILASEAMDDSADGGGGLVEIPIVDGQSNNIFKDISHLKRTYGGVNMAKVNAAVRTQTNEPLLGAFVFLDKIPGDKKLSVNLFSTDAPYDLRADAAARVENYRAQGGKYLGFLYGTQYQGSQIITIFQMETAPIPANGEVLLLMRLSPAVQQYVRVVSVATQIQTFTDTNGSYKRRVVTLGVATPLKYDFPGVDINRFDALNAPSLIYMTTVANAARYYSARPLKNNATLGDYSINVDTVYSQVVPSSQSEMPLVDLTASGSVTPLIASSNNTIAVPIGFAISSNVSIYLGRPCYPGSLDMVYGGGHVYDSGGQITIGGVSIGTINYAAGIISFGATAPNIGSGVVATFTPAGVPLAVADTDAIPVTDASRSFVYVFNITPPPAPGALSISCRALENWYEFRDNGAGGLIPLTDGTGAGTINYATGSIAITFSSLPDVGSQIILAWGKTVDYNNRAGGVVKCTLSKQLSHDHIVGSSLVISWYDTDNVTQHTITSDAAGVLSGAGTGQLQVLTGLVSFSPNTMPAEQTVFSFAYNYIAGDTAAKVAKAISSFDMNDHVVTMNLLDTNIVPGSVVISWLEGWGSSIPLLNPPLSPGEYLTLPQIASGSINKEVRDNALGGVVGGRPCTINYSTGIITLDWFVPVPLKFPWFGTRSKYDTVGSAALKGYIAGNADIATPGWFNLNYRLSGGTVTPATDSLTVSNFDIAIPADGETLIAGSVHFTFGGKSYVDRMGQLYHSISTATGNGTFGGTINYTSGQVSLQSWSVGDSNNGVVSAALSSPNYNPTDRVVFRTPQAPIKPASFSIRAGLASGGQVSATSNDGGVINTANIVGTIDNNTGIAVIDFGVWLTAAGNESQPWFDPAKIVNGQIFKPIPVMAETVVYNAVSYTFIPLSADILGLDPVRLPIDGRIPVFHKGDVVVVLNDQTTVLTATSNTTTDLGRVRLSKITVRDLGNNLLPVDKWTANLDTGIVSWGDLSGVSQPLKIVDRVQDMAVLSDVQINGKLSLSTPVTHDYANTVTLVASAVVFGDIYAHASNPFDQQTWTNVWENIAIGNTTSAQFNYTAYPVEVTNSGTIEERWLIQFVSATMFNLIGEHVGQIVTGASIASDLAPMNPATNDAYFTLRRLGFGGGWSAGNCLRFNTYQAAKPLWIIQSILQGNQTSDDYGFCLSFNGDVDAP